MMACCCTLHLSLGELHDGTWRNVGGKGLTNRLRQGGIHIANKAMLNLARVLSHNPRVAQDGLDKVAARLRLCAAECVCVSIMYWCVCVCVCLYLGIQLAANGLAVKVGNTGVHAQKVSPAPGTAVQLGTVKGGQGQGTEQSTPACV